MSRSNRKKLYFERNKEARRMMKLYNTSWKYLDEAIVPLDKPYRNGFVRHFVIRPDLLRSPKKTILQSLLPILDNTAFCKTRKFIDKDWKTGKMKPMTQELNVLDERKFNTLTDQQKSYFQLTKRKVKQWYGGFREDIVYIFKFPWMFEYKIKPSFVTHRAIPNSENESLRKKLGDKLWQQYFAYENGVAERGRWWYEDRNKVRDRALARVIKDEVREALD